MREDMAWLKILPSIEWTEKNFSKIPEKGCVYFIVDPDYNLLYIGKTQHLNYRLGNMGHHVWDEARKVSGDRPPILCWLSFPRDEGLLLTMEAALIYQYQPPLNRFGKKSSPFLQDRIERRNRLSVEQHQKKVEWQEMMDKLEKSAALDEQIYG